MSELYEKLTLSESKSMSTVGGRNVIVNYLTSTKPDQVPDKLELGIIQSKLNEWPPSAEFEYGPSGKFKLHGVTPPQPPVVAIKFGDVRIELPADCQLHEIRDGEHSALDADLSQETMMEFVAVAEDFPPRLSELAEFLAMVARRPREPEIDPEWIVFQFEAADPKGQMIKDIIAAPSADDAKSTIENMGYTITKFSVKENKE